MLVAPPWYLTAAACRAELDDCNRLAFIIGSSCRNRAKAEARSGLVQCWQ